MSVFYESPRNVSLEVLIRNSMKLNKENPLQSLSEVSGIDISILTQMAETMEFYKIYEGSSFGLLDEKIFPKVHHSCNTMVLEYTENSFQRFYGHLRIRAYNSGDLLLHDGNTRVLYLDNSGEISTKMELIEDIEDTVKKFFDRNGKFVITEVSDRIDLIKLSIENEKELFRLLPKKII